MCVQELKSWMPEGGGEDSSNQSGMICSTLSVRSVRKSRIRGIFGFSLVEILVVIAIIAILSAIAVPAIRYTMSQAAESKNRRNAQHLATISAAVIASGHEGTNSVGAWISMLTNGVTVTNTFGESIAYFHTVELKPEDISGLSSYLSVTNSQLSYRPDGTN